VLEGEDPWVSRALSGYPQWPGDTNDWPG